MSTLPLIQKDSLLGAAILAAMGVVWTVRRRPACVRRMIVGLFMALTLAAGKASAEEWSLPKEVPNLLNPQVVRTYALVGTGVLFGDPDFPVIVLRRQGDGTPFQILVVLDARNGKSTWSLGEDPVIFALLLTSAKEPTVSFLDEGFLATGHPLGVFGRRENLSSMEASDLLHQGIDRSVEQNFL